MKELAMPFQVGWDIVHRCNYRCHHCYFDDSQLSDKTMPDKREAIDFVRYLASKRVFHLSLAGGEPLLYPHIVDVVRTATRGGMTVAMSTNASVLFDSLAKQLREAGLRSLQISLDGPDENTNDMIRGVGTFEKTVAGLEVAIRNGFQIILAIVIVQANRHEIRRFFEFAANRKVKGVKVQTLIDSGLGQINADKLSIPESELRQLITELWEEKKLYAGQLEVMLPLVPEVIEQAREEPEYFNKDSSCLGCQPGLSTLRVNAYGDVRACGGFVNAPSIGNVFVTELQNIWKDSSELIRWRNQSEVENGQSTTSCGSICGNGCRSQSAPRFART